MARMTTVSALFAALLLSVGIAHADDMKSEESMDSMSDSMEMKDDAMMKEDEMAEDAMDMEDTMKTDEMSDG